MCSTTIRRGAFRVRNAAHRPLDTIDSISSFVESENFQLLIAHGVLGKLKSGYIVLGVRLERVRWRCVGFGPH